MTKEKLRANLRGLKARVIDTSALIARHVELKAQLEAAVAERRRMGEEKAAAESTAALRSAAEAAVKQQLEAARGEVQQHKTESARLRTRLSDLEAVLLSERSAASSASQAAVKVSLAEQGATTREAAVLERAREPRRPGRAARSDWTFLGPFF